MRPYVLRLDIIYRRLITMELLLFIGFVWAAVWPLFCKPEPVEGDHHDL